MIDPDEIVRFATGWSRTRGVAAPIAENGVLRVEVGLPDQRRRYVFPHAPLEMAAVAATITEPLIFLKAAIPPEAVRAMLPPQWHVEQTGVMMTIGTLPPISSVLVSGYHLSLVEHDRVVAAIVTDEAGTQVARGRMTIIDRTALHDRISVDPAHQRKGLGGAVMTALGSAAAGRGATDGILAATVMGRALYETLGWNARSPWTTAHIPPAHDIA